MLNNVLTVGKVSRFPKEKISFPKNFVEHMVLALGAFDYAVSGYGFEAWTQRYMVMFLCSRCFCAGDFPITQEQALDFLGNPTTEYVMTNWLHSADKSIKHAADCNVPLEHACARLSKEA